MKLFLKLLTLLLLLSPWAKAQELDKKMYRQEIREAKKDVKELEKENWDVIIRDPIEIVPSAEYPFYVTDVTNWGREILLPKDLEARMAAECTGQVIWKVTDTGGRQSHQDLQEGQLPGSNYSTDAELDDLHGHGTHVAGIGVAKEFGLMYPLVKKGLVNWKPVKFLGNAGQGSYAGIVNGVLTEDQENEDYLKKGLEVVVNASWGGSTAKYEPLDDAIGKSAAKGVIWVFAAGNTGREVIFPGNSYHVVTTASLDQSLVASSFSCRGPEVDNAAPGRSIVSTYKEGGYATLSGTSMAAPFMSSLVCIAKSRWPGQLTDHQKVKSYFQKISTDLKPEGRDDPTGWGIAYVRAILDNSPGQAPDPDPDPEPEPDPDPEPEPEPNPVKPNRELTFPMVDRYQVKWRASNHSDMQALSFAITVDLKTKLLAEKAYDDLKSATDRHFRGRSYFLSKNSDYNDACKAVVVFYNMLLKRDFGLDVSVQSIRGYDSKGRPIDLSDQDLKRSQRATARQIRQAKINSVTNN